MSQRRFGRRTVRHTIPILLLLLLPTPLLAKGPTKVSKKKMVLQRTFTAAEAPKKN